MSSFNQNVIRHKIGLLNLAAELGNVSKACKVMGLSRDTFYRYQNAVAEGGVEALFDSNRRKPNPKNRVEEATETAVLAYAIEQPAHGQVRASNELRQRGIFVSPSGVRSIWLRNDTASASASTKRSCRSFIRWRSGASCTCRWTSYRLILMPGWPITTMSELIRVRCAADARLCKP
jgi:transposase